MAFTDAERDVLFAGIENDGKQEEELSNVCELIDAEVSRGDPSLIAEAYEFGLCLFPTLVPLWLRYLNWLDNGLKIPSKAAEAYKSAVRCVPTNPDIMQLALIAYERAGESAESISELWEAAKQAIADPEWGRSLYTTYIFLLKRRVSAEQEDRAVKDFTDVATVFEEGYSFLRNSYQHWDPYFKYRLMYAYFLYSTVVDVPKAREILRDILSSGGNLQPKVVIDAVTYERHFGRDIIRCRHWLYQAVNSVFDENAHTLFEFFLQFEREEGTLEELGKAVKKINSQAQRLLQREEQLKQREEQRKKQRNGTPNVKAPKRKMAEEKEEKIEVPKKRPAMVRDEDGFVVPALPTTARKVANNIGLPSSATDESQTQDKKPKGKHIEKDIKPEFQYSQGLEKNKLFVSSVNYDCNEDKLKEVFSQFGNVTGARIVTHKTGKSKGIAYIVYDSEESAQKAVDADEIIVMGRRVKVAFSNPPPRKPMTVPGAKLPGMHRRLDMSSPTHKTDNAKNKKTAASSANGSNLSNDEFRKYL